MTYLSDKKRIELAILPALIFSLMQDAFNASKTEEEKESVSKILKISFIIYTSFADSPKLVKRVSKLVHKILSLFVDKRDGTYHIRKVILCLYEVTQRLIYEGRIDDQIALVVQDALELEHASQISDKDWFALKESAEKRVEDVIKLINE